MEERGGNGEGFELGERKLKERRSYRHCDEDNTKEIRERGRIPFLLLSPLLREKKLKIVPYV